LHRLRPGWAWKVGAWRSSSAPVPNMPRKVLCLFCCGPSTRAGS
jgi:hypothetical protein